MGITMYGYYIVWVLQCSRNYIVWVLYCMGITTRGYYIVVGTTMYGYYIVWEVWLMKNPPIKPASLCFFRRLGAFCGVFGGEV